MYYIPEPPIGLLLFGLFIGVTCGLAFEATLKQQVSLWRQQQKSQIEKDGLSLMGLPFLGVCIGVCMFLAAGLEVFTYSRVFSYLIAGALTIFTGGLVWVQLQKLLLLFLKGGSRALDLDFF
ncbi:MAG: hypothetical protein NZ901_00370 [Geminocystis sp.]|nr:hypothetical protein [Geminocystis sp.]MCS7146622.1 hypothetical protein [Geminocystis sp.]MCX8077479.1 hypothetical protein [Geminocystis sp.]MDW8115448.1 hypothetical protein [Geminocystis sp.]HIK37575.1 hypothetical protein [Geminocystis sp. M7585_C2015_104]